MDVPFDNEHVDHPVPFQHGKKHITEAPGNRPGTANVGGWLFSRVFVFSLKEA
jgi:hypothetical protein